MSRSSPAILFLALALAPAAGCSRRPSHGGSPALADGDLVFQESQSSQSEAIGIATGSRYTHMGIVYVQNGKPRVLEAAKTVRLTDFDAWVARGAGQHVVVKRLENADTVLTPETLAHMKAAGEALHGRAYDLRFEWTDDRIYCSELVYKIYERGAGIRIGELQRFGDFPLDHPVVARKLRERFGATIPRDEKVVSPESMFRDGKLITVLQR